MRVNPADFLTQSVTDSLRRAPAAPYAGTCSGGKFSARIVIPDIKKEIAAYFTEARPEQFGPMVLPFKHFGVEIAFDKHVTLEAFDDAFNLHPAIKALIVEFGTCSFRNVELSKHIDTVFQKNIFPNLVFHVDRGPQFENQYSLFYRDPADPDHKHPRKSSSLVTPNIAVVLQAKREGIDAVSAAVNCKLFDDDGLDRVLGKIVFEQRWDAPEGVGEMCVFDNRTVMHASYHREPGGYRIAVQYLF